MRVRFKHFPEFGITLNFFSGALTPEVMMDWIASLERVAWANRIIYLDPSLDLSGLPISFYPILRRALADKLRELYGEARVHSVLVSAELAHEFFLRFWPSYVGKVVEYPTEPTSVPTIQGACELLGLPGEASRAFSDFVSAP